MTRIALVVPLAALALAACSASDSEPAPGEMSVSERRALMEANEMIEKGRPGRAAPSAGASAAPEEGKQADEP